MSKATLKTAFPIVHIRPRHFWGYFYTPNGTKAIGHSGAKLEALTPKCIGCIEAEKTDDEIERLRF